MNIKEKLTCNYCKEIYKQPLSLNCCAETICKCHIEELLSIDDSNTFVCPYCDEKNSNQKFKVNKLIQDLVENELHHFKIDNTYTDTLNKFKEEIEKFESILTDPENFIYEEMSELKRKVDLNREELKSEIDELANDLIKKLEEYEQKFKSEYKTNANLELYNGLVDSSKKKLAEYEKFLNLFSTTKEERDEKKRQSEKEISSLRLKLREVKDKLFSNFSIRYRPIENQREDLFGKLIIKVIEILFYNFLLIKVH
jgi:chromosome segregation ATPase